MKNWQRIICAAVLVVAMAAPAYAQNLLTNPGFEDGLNGWGVFGNAYAETTSPDFVPYEGNGLCSMFGNFWGVFNVTGIFQEFPTGEGATWELSCVSKNPGVDPMIGLGATDYNWVVQKIAFFDAANTEIGAAEFIICDGTYMVDIWNVNPVTVGVAPAGTVKVQALVLYLQPLMDGGACHIDNVVFENTGGPVPVENSSWGKIKSLYE